MDILITGGNGQLGTELRYLLDERDIEYVSTGKEELDITDEKSVNDYFEKKSPTVVFHCAAYTSVDAAEEEPGKTLNELINVQGTKNIAEAAVKYGAILVFISTDYVFDGTKFGEYTEQDKVNPQNEYGRSKAQAEKLVQDICLKYYIVRTSWVFGKYGKNFVFTMQKLAETHSELSVVDDQVGRPTWTRTLAEFMTYLVDNNCEYGLYQLSNEGSCSWYEFAKEILKDKEVIVNPVTSDKFPQKAYRPKHSVMSLEKVKNTGFTIIDWKEAIETMKR